MMTTQFSDMIKGLDTVIDRISSLSSDPMRPMVVAIDGASGAGKSTVSEMLKSKLSAAVIPLDDFFSAHIPDAKWDEFSVEEKLEKVFDWNRLRTQALLPLLANQQAKWYAFDFNAGTQEDGTYNLMAAGKTSEPAGVIIIDGTYSASPHLAEVVNLTVLIDVPVQERHTRLYKREDPSFIRQWHKRWDVVEDFYFEQVRPKNSFDIIINAGLLPSKR
jgi:uridine kinase